MIGLILRGTALRQGTIRYTSYIYDYSIVAMFIYHIAWMFYRRSPESSGGRREGGSPEDREHVDRPPQHQDKLNNSHLRIRGLTRNVTAGHVEEIMGTFGKIEKMHFAMDEALNLPRGYADVTYEREEDGTKAKEYMHEGQIDGARVTVVYRRNIGRDKRDKKKRAQSPRGGLESRKSPQARKRSKSPQDKRMRMRSPSRSPYRSRDWRDSRRGRSPPPYAWKERNRGGGSRRDLSRSPSPRDPRSWKERKSGGRKSWGRSRSPYRPRRMQRSPSPYARRGRSISQSPSRSYSYSSRSRSRSRSRSYSSGYSSLSR